MAEDTLYIVIPAYNEEETIEQVARDWHRAAELGGEDSRLVIVNDGSRDGTEEKLRALQQELPRLIPLTKENGGHGAAVLYGYRYALAHGASYVFQTDSDGQTLPEEFPFFWENRRAYAAIIGRRNKRQDGLSRIIVTKVLKLVLLIVLHVNVPDANTPFRLMDAGVLEKYLPRIPEDFNLSNVLLSALLVKHGEKVLFTPITFKPRQGGVNSINLRKIVKIGLKAVQDFRTLRRSL